jgi:hypothetical protein
VLLGRSTTTAVGSLTAALNITLLGCAATTARGTIVGVVTVPGVAASILKDDLFAFYEVEVLFAERQASDLAVLTIPEELTCTT